MALVDDIHTFFAGTPTTLAQAADVVKFADQKLVVAVKSITYPPGGQIKLGSLFGVVFSVTNTWGDPRARYKNLKIHARQTAFTKPLDPAAGAPVVRITKDVAAILEAGDTVDSPEFKFKATGAHPFPIDEAQALATMSEAEFDIVHYFTVFREQSHTLNIIGPVG